MNIPFPCDNISEASAHGVYMYKMVRYYMACFSFCTKMRYTTEAAIGAKYSYPSGARAPEITA